MSSHFVHFTDHVPGWRLSFLQSNHGEYLDLIAALWKVREGLIEPWADYWSRLYQADEHTDLDAWTEQRFTDAVVQLEELAEQAAEKVARKKWPDGPPAAPANGARAAILALAQQAIALLDSETKVLDVDAALDLLTDARLSGLLADLYGETAALVRPGTEQAPPTPPSDSLVQEQAPPTQGMLTGQRRERWACVRAEILAILAREQPLRGKDIPGRTARRLKYRYIRKVLAYMKNITHEILKVKGGYVVA
jgi:hypothetical protein